ncbi:hypothetical protein AAF712_014803 [Marasmius tenuissimus]|uniref:F-box domain-containing protein n=1 Tax=Marasmius tenuissimus TaxID=585030 RepID=A0ABR2ZA03_9AGAR
MDVVRLTDIEDDEKGPPSNEIGKTTATTVRFSARSIGSHIHTAVTPPIDQFLPDDLLALIFRTCVDTDIKDCQPNRSAERKVTYPGKLSPWVLAQVCRRWRYLTLELSQLWNVVDVNSTDGNESPSSPLGELVFLQLKRAKDQPLSVRYNAGGLSKGLRSVHDLSVLVTLLSRSSQWSTATISIHTSGLLRLSSQYIGSFNLLTALHLHLLSENLSEGQLGSIVKVFRSAPKLRSLTTTGFVIILHHVALDLPFERIVDFTSKDYDTTPVLLSYHGHYHFLQKLPNLETCMIDTPYSFNAHDLPPSVVPRFTLAHLHTLVLRNFLRGSSHIDVVLNWLTLPVLRILRFPSGFESSAALIELLERSECSLEELHLKFGHVHEGALFRLFDAPCMQNLRVLSIGGYRWGHGRTVDNDIFRPLTLVKPPSAVYRLPKLRALELCDSDAWTIASMLDMLESRWDTGNVFPGTVEKLWRLTIRNSGMKVSLNQEEKRRIEKLRDGGTFFEWNENPR